MRTEEDATRAEIVDLSSGRIDRVRLRHSRVPWASLVPAAVVTLAVCAVVFAASIPWPEPGPTDAGETGSSAAPGAPTASESRSPTITVENLGASEVAVDINQWQVDESLGCGAVRTYDLVAYPSQVDVWAMPGSHAAISTSHSIWLVDLPTGWIAYDTAPTAAQLFSMCGTIVRGHDPGGQVDWVLDSPVASSDAVINLGIFTALHHWLDELRRTLPASAGGQSTIQSSWSVSQMPALTGIQPHLLSLQFDFTVTAGAEIHAVPRYLDLAMPDGHEIGIEELFTSPADGLAILSSESVRLLPRGSAGSVRTSPNATNFEAWAPYADGLHVNLQYADAWPDGPDPSEGIDVTIPWPALDGLIKPDSPVRDWWTP